MDVIVLGSGVIGTTTAHYLARAGARVTVIDRQDGAGLETSFANAGQVSPGYSTPWAAPGIPAKAAKWLLQRHAPLAIRPDGTPIVGRTAWSNLWLNTGHGTLGWTMACGSGQLLADQISGRQPQIDTDGLAVERYRRCGARMPSTLGTAGLQNEA